MHTNAYHHYKHIEVSFLVTVANEHRETNADDAFLLEQVSVFLQLLTRGSVSFNPVGFYAIKIADKMCIVKS